MIESFWLILIFLAAVMVGWIGMSMIIKKLWP